ncbi:hypothetical protein LTR17_013185 [Elasticomyces elasticus]|nr:hypothetical protein LTR17_013185 [Elasticomyces elasticus]
MSNNVGQAMKTSSGQSKKKKKKKKTAQAQKRQEENLRGGGMAQQSLEDAESVMGGSQDGEGEESADEELPRAEEKVVKQGPLSLDRSLAEDHGLVDRLLTGHWNEDEEQWKVPVLDPETLAERDRRALRRMLDRATLTPRDLGTLAMYRHMDSERMWEGWVEVEKRMREQHWALEFERSEEVRRLTVAMKDAVAIAEGVAAVDGVAKAGDFVLQYKAELEKMGRRCDGIAGFIDSLQTRDRAAALRDQKMDEREIKLEELAGTVRADRERMLREVQQEKEDLARKIQEHDAKMAKRESDLTSGTARVTQELGRISEMAASMQAADLKRQTRVDELVSMMETGFNDAVRTAMAQDFAGPVKMAVGTHMKSKEFAEALREFGEPASTAEQADGMQTTDQTVGVKPADLQIEVGGMKMPMNKVVTAQGQWLKRLEKSVADLKKKPEELPGKDETSAVIAELRSEVDKIKEDLRQSSLADAGTGGVGAVGDDGRIPSSVSRGNERAHNGGNSSWQGGSRRGPYGPGPNRQNRGGHH